MPESGSTEQIYFEVNLDMQVRQHMLKQISLESAEGTRKVNRMKLIIHNLLRRILFHCLTLASSFSQTGKNLLVK